MALRDVTNSIPTEAQLSDAAMDVAGGGGEQYFQVIKARKLLHGRSTQQAQRASCTESADLCDHASQKFTRSNVSMEEGGSKFEHLSSCASLALRDEDADYNNLVVQGSAAALDNIPPNLGKPKVKTRVWKKCVVRNEVAVFKTAKEAKLSIPAIFPGRPFTHDRTVCGGKATEYKCRCGGTQMVCGHKVKVAKPATGNNYIMTYSIDPEDPDPTHACDRLLIGPLVVNISQGPPVVRKKPNARMTELADAYFDAGMTPAQIQPLLAGKVLLGEDPPSWKWLRNRVCRALFG
mmetsp:Transcript_42775/g.76747  ORF Transcript_42775/g.76747 Transcript_42775/m.76747 type:complete len:292 (+) Transcript_42775:145-1020(+)